MKKMILGALLLSMSAIQNPLWAQDKSPTDYVNPFIGTSNYGCTVPGPAMPGGMVSMSPFNTIPRGSEHKVHTDSWCSTSYTWDNKWMIGFTQVNLSGVGCPDLGSLLLMPTTGKLEVDYQKYASLMEDQTAHPGYFSAKIKSYNVLAEMTATTRTTRSRYTFNDGGESHILFNIGKGLTTESGCYARIVNDSEVEGFRLMGDFCYGQPQSVIPIYFVVRTSKPAAKVQYWKKQPAFKGAVKDWVSYNDAYKVYTQYNQQMAGDEIGVAFDFNATPGEQVEVSVGISYVSIENARENLALEQQGMTFDKIRTACVNSWNRALGVVKLDGGTEDQKVQFYTSLYHNWFHPNVLQDANGDYPEMVTGRTRRMPKGQDRLTMFSGWDVYRISPFMGALFYPERQNSMAMSMMQMYRESGNLPKFEVLARDFMVMSGDAALPYMSACYFLGLTKGIDPEALYQAMLKNATAPAAENPVRGDQSFYTEHHYIPLTAKYDNSVSQAIELYIADWSLGQVAKSLGKTSDYQMLNARAMGYRKYFDAAYGLLRPVLPDGTFMPGFNPLEGENFAPVNGFHEGTSWNYTYSFPYDIEGLISQFGSHRRFVDSLSACFDKGYFDMGNEPDMSYPYLFNYVKGSEWKTQFYVNQCLTRYFGNTPGGLPGNDDAGTMSAWQALSMMGIYPPCPSKAEYTFTTPVFDRVTIALDSNYYTRKELVIEAVNRTPENIYIEKIELDGKPLRSYFISHKALTDAGRLTIYCTNKPKK